MSQVIPELSEAQSADARVSIRNSTRVIFAGQLRAIAFLSVVIVHWLGIYSLDPAFISSVTGAVNSNVGDPSYYLAILPPLPYFNFGPFGVSIFFLISGFVIKYSLNNKSRIGYLKSRLIRIYPTYIACSVVMMAFYVISHAYWRSEPGISIERFIFNASLMSSIFNYESMDYVNWTLSIEIKFYFCCALMYSAIKSGSVMSVMMFPVIVMIVSFVTSHFQIGSSEQGHFSFDALKIELMYASFMFLGILLNFLYDDKISIGEFIGSSVVVAICVAMSWKVGPQSNQFTETGINYIYGYIFFCVAMLLNKHIKENRLMSFLSQISYSFYALHSVIGYCIIRWMQNEGFNYAYSLLVAFASVMILSYLMYITVERKSIKLGKRMV